jgi:hypothetical protein
VHKSTLALICASFLGLACGDSGSSSTSLGETGNGDGDGDGDSGGECVPPNVVPPEPTPIDPLCLVDTPCVEDANCPSGYTCNAGLAPPSCSKIYCGVAGNPCSAAASCSVDLQCVDGICDSCDVCGDLCSVDFQTDPQHCGCCDNPVPASGDAECVNGEIVCTSSSATLCGSECVSLTDDAHCGGCDRACPVDSEGCEEGGCPVVTTDRLSCTDVCAEVGLVCAGTDHVAYYLGNAEDESLPIESCDEVPAEDHTCNGVSCNFINVRCFCTFP